MTHPPPADWDPMVPIVDPYPMFHAWEEEGSAFAVEKGFHAIVGYEHVHAALLDDETFSSRAFRPPRGDEPEHLVKLDGEPHRRQRRLLSHAFTPRALQAADELVRRVADDLLDRFCEQGSAELVRSYCAPLPSIVFSELLGVPAADQEMFLAWADDAIAHAESGDGAPSDPDFRAYIVERVQERRSEPRHDLLSELVYATDEEQRLTDRELVATVRILIIAGNETTGNMLGTLFRHLLEDRTRWERLQADESLGAVAVEEALRIDPPLLWVPRVCARTADVDGTLIPEQAPVALCLGAANHDASVYEEPDRFRLDRPARGGRPHLAFGFGEHFCLGAHLARLEGRVALERVLSRLPDIELEPGFAFEPKGPLMFRGPKRLPVRFTPSTRSTPASGRQPSGGADAALPTVKEDGWISD